MCFVKPGDEIGRIFYLRWILVLKFSTANLFQFFYKFQPNEILFGEKFISR